MLTGIADDLADGPDAVDREQLELAVELLRDVGDYSEDDTVDEVLEPDTPLGKLVAYVLDPTASEAEPAVRQGGRAVDRAGELRRVAAASGIATLGRLASVRHATHGVSRRPHARRRCG